MRSQSTVDETEERNTKNSSKFFAYSELKGENLCVNTVKTNLNLIRKKIFS